MPAYIVAVYRCTSRANAVADTIQSVLADSCVHAIHDASPVILAGLVKGGEIRTLRQWNDEAKTGEALCVGANGRVIDNFAPAAHVESVLPITWYRYEAP